MKNQVSKEIIKLEVNKEIIRESEKNIKEVQQQIERQYNQAKKDAKHTFCYF